MTPPIRTATTRRRAHRRRQQARFAAGRGKQCVNSPTFSQPASEAGERISSSVLISPPSQRYGAIYLDPPWRFEVWSRDTGMGRSAESHYPTMPITDIKALPVPSLMADDCAVFMWATWPTLPDALELGKAWGLEYKTCAFLWAKLNPTTAGRFVELTDDANWFMGMGYWTRANTEMCLLFTKGSPKRKARNVRQLVVDPVRRHSQKPDSIYAAIEALVDGPYCELFARQSWDGWARWGNEVESTVSLPLFAA